MRVKVLRWPSEAQKRKHFRDLGIPRLFIVEGQERPPPALDSLEDWVRPPINPDDMRARVVALQYRALASVPVLDQDDILRFGGDLVSLSPIEAAVMRALIDSYQSVVPRKQLLRVAWPCEQPSRNAFDLCILRLRRRIAPLNLSIRTVWRKGYLLEYADDGDGG